MSSRGIILVVALGIAVAGCADGRDAAAPASGSTDRTPGPGSGATTAIGSATTPEGRQEPAEAGLSAGPPSDTPVPRVVGNPLDAACREIRGRGYVGAVFTAEGAGGRGPRRVVEQYPDPGTTGGAVGAPVYLGVPGPLPQRLPAGTPCGRRVIRDLPADFPTTTDE